MHRIDVLKMSYQFSDVTSVVGDGRGSGNKGGGRRLDRRLLQRMR